MPGSSWTPTRWPLSASGRKSGAKRGHRITQTISSSSWGWPRSRSTGAGSRKGLGRSSRDVQSWVRHPVIRWMAATLDGTVEDTGAVFEAKFMLPWSFSEEAAAEKHMAQVQHNMWVTNAREAVLSIITGGGKWVEIKISADPLYQHLLLTAEKKFWRCVENGEPPRLFGVDPPRPRIAAMRIVDMSSSNAWAEFSGVFRRTRDAPPRT